MVPIPSHFVVDETEGVVYFDARDAGEMVFFTPS